MKKGIILLLAIIFAVSASANISLNSSPKQITGKIETQSMSSPGTRDLLWDQTGNPSGDGSSAAQDFVDPGFDAYDCWGADDFEVPAGETWTIDSAYFAGGYWNGAGPGTGFGNMKIYSDAGMPGTELYDLPGCAVVDDGAGNLDITLSTPVDLSEGIYWVAWQQTVEYAVGGQWGVSPHMANYGNVWYWINPLDGFGNGTDWIACTTMWPANVGTDLTYALYGTIGGGLEYCEASTTYEDEFIENVTCVEINNTTGWQGGVADYTAMSASIEVGASADITVNVGGFWSSDHVTCWVDWNDDFTWELGGDEEFILPDGSANFEGAITVPAGTALGLHRMRVRLTYSSAPDPCGSSNYGEVEDYMINVIAGGPVNDFCEGAIAVVEGMGYPFDTTDATSSGFGTHNFNQDLWYVYTPGSDGSLYVGVCDTAWDTKLAIYGECDPGTELDYNDDSCSMQSELFDITVVGGEDYYIQVGGYSSSYYGEGLLDIIFTSSGAPIIAVTPMTISETLITDEVVVVPVTIENTGTADLTFDITVVETSLLARTPVINHVSPIYDPANAESDPMIREIDDAVLSDVLFDLQFQYACYDAGGEAGIETDGNFIYVPLWNGSDYLRYNLDGSFVEYFTVAGTAQVRDLAYDGQYFYGAAANTSLFEMDFTPGAEALVSTITAPVSCRAIAYDDGADGFWANNWSDTITLFDRSGTVLNTLTISPTYQSYYGFAYDDYSTGGPFLWGFSQALPGGILVQYDIAAGGETGVVFDVGGLVGGASAGGLFIAEGLWPGFVTIGCMIQNEFMVGLELCPGDEPWITVTPLTGTVPAGTSVVVDVTLDAAGLDDITKTADIVIANNAGADVVVDVTMIVENPIPVYDPPTNVVVDEMTGIVTWDAPAVGGVIIEDNFDSYTVGDYIAEVGDDWTTWSNAPGGAEDALVTDVEASSPSNSVVVELNQDLVLIMDDYTSGVYTYEMKMFVPTGYCGYYNLQVTNVPGTGWAFQIYFQTDGTALADAGAAGALTYAFNHDEWMDLKIVVDLDTDWATYYHDGVEMIGWQYTLGTFGAGIPLSFGGVNIFGGANSGGPGDTPMFYFDDVVLSSGAVRDLTGYNVYLDGVLLDTVGIDVFDFTYEDLVNGDTYTAGISAVYDDVNESIIVEDTFEYGGEDAGNVIVAVTELNGNYPNPFNPVTNIAYSIKEAGKVTLQVYNVKGQLVKTLVDDVRETGNYTVTWNGRDNTNKSVASGVYFYKMKAQNYNNTKKMILMK